MSLEKLKNETLTKLKTCKRENEINEVLIKTDHRLKENKDSSKERVQFWQDIYHQLGERNLSSLEQEAKNSVAYIVELSRDRIEKIVEKENNVR